MVSDTFDEENLDKKALMGHVWALQPNDISALSRRRYTWDLYKKSMELQFKDVLSEVDALKKEMDSFVSSINKEIGVV